MMSGLNAEPFLSIFPSNIQWLYTNEKKLYLFNAQWFIYRNFGFAIHNSQFPCRKRGNFRPHILEERARLIESKKMNICKNESKWSSFCGNAIMATDQWIGLLPFQANQTMILRSYSCDFYIRSLYRGTVCSPNVIHSKRVYASECVRVCVFILRGMKILLFFAYYLSPTDVPMLQCMQKINSRHLIRVRV